MFGWLKKDPVKTLEQTYARKLQQAMELQRKGDIMGYSNMAAEADAVLNQLRDAEARQGT